MIEAENIIYFQQIPITDNNGKIEMHHIHKNSLNPDKIYGYEIIGDYIIAYRYDGLSPLVLYIPNLIWVEVDKKGIVMNFKLLEIPLLVSVLDLPIKWEHKKRGNN